MQSSEVLLPEISPELYNEYRSARLISAPECRAAAYQLGHIPADTTLGNWIQKKVNFTPSSIVQV